MITSEDIKNLIQTFKENTEVVEYPNAFITDKWSYITLKYPNKKRRWYKRIMRHNYAK